MIHPIPDLGHMGAMASVRRTKEVLQYQTETLHTRRWPRILRAKKGSCKLHLLPGVMLAVHRLQTVGIDVRVNLGGDDVGVTEQFLHDPQIRPA